MSFSIELLYLRRPSIDYISPPVCEVTFSASGVVIVLDPISPQNFPTGLVLGGIGNFRLSWNSYPGALCYSVYKATDSNNPEMSTYTIVLECIQDNSADLQPFGPGCYRVSAITLDGETPLSNPICGVGTFTMAPLVITDPADNISSNSAQLHGRVNPVGSLSDAFFQWGLTTSYGSVTPTQNVGAGQDFLAIQADLVGLIPATTYHFRAVGRNENGTSFGDDALFVTQGSGPPPEPSIFPVDLNPLSDLADSAGIVVGGFASGSRPGYFFNGTTQDTRTSVDSSPITGSQTLTTVTASEDFFMPSDVGLFIEFSTSERAQIVSYTSPTSVEVTPSQSVASTTFVRRGNTLGGTTGTAQVCNSSLVIGGIEDNISDVSHLFWLDVSASDMRDLGAQADAIDIHADGTLLIDYFGPPANLHRGKLYDPITEVATDIGLLVIGPGNQTQPVRMNENKDVIATCAISPIQTKAGLYTGVWTDIHPAAAGANSSIGVDVNENQECVGWWFDGAPVFQFKGWVRFGGVSTVLSGRNLPVGISNSGRVAGNDDAALTPWIYRDGIGFEAIPLLPSATYGTANSINDSNWVVGDSDAGVSGQAAWIYRDGVLQFLFDLIPAGNPGWTELFTAQFTNNNTQITGFGKYLGATTGYILTLT